MKLRHAIWAAGLLLASATLLAGRWMYAEDAEEGVENAATRWEFAYLVEITGGRQPYSRLESGQATLEETELFQLYRRLGGQGEEAEFNRMHLLDLLGTQGWELASTDFAELENARLVRAFALKRAIR